MSEELGGITVKLEKVLIWLSPVVIAFGGWYMAQADDAREETKVLIEKNAVAVKENTQQISRIIRIFEVSENEQEHVKRRADSTHQISQKNRERIIKLESKH